MLDRDAILQLWKLGGEFKAVAETEVLSEFDTFGDLFFDWLAEGETSLRERASREFCFLNSGLPTVGRPLISSSCNGRFSQIAGLYECFMSTLKRCLSRHPSPDGLLQTVYSFFPGIRPDLESDYPQLRGRLPEEERHRQLMVFVCGQCNLHCPYCFSHDLARTEISGDSLRDIFSWAAREGCRIVTPCGGEPLLYSNLQLFMDLIADYGMTTYMASNFTVDVSSICGFDSERVKRLYVHFTNESLGDSRLRGIIERNIGYCKDARIDMTARVNLTSPDLDKALRWIDQTKAAGLRRLNIALTIPSRYKANRFTDPEEFGAFIAVISRMVDYAEDSGIALGIAKPLPMCMFPDEAAMKLLRADANISLCGIHQEGYMNNLSLSTDLAFSPCLGLTDVRRSFDLSLRWNDLSAAFAPGVKRLLDREVKDECRRCFLYARGLCQGFCLSYKYRSDEDF